jgi:MFS family permease
LSSFSTGFVDFCVYRFPTGLGVGGVLGLAVALVADSVPDPVRAPALGLLQGLSMWAIFPRVLSAWPSAHWPARHLLPLGFKSWQMLFLIGAVPAFFCVFILRRLPEPAKWVEAKAAGLKKGIKFGSYINLLGNSRWAKHAWLGLILCLPALQVSGIGNFHPRIVRSIIESHPANSGLSADAITSERSGAVSRCFSKTPVGSWA